MKVAYIAGPFRADNSWEIEKNIRVAEAIGYERLLPHNIMFICPHSNARFSGGTFTDEIWLDCTAELLLRCDLMVLTSPGAPDISEGTAGEVEIAREMGIPIYYFIGDTMIEYLDLGE